MSEATRQRIRLSTLLIALALACPLGKVQPVVAQALPAQETDRPLRPLQRERDVAQATDTIPEARFGGVEAVRSGEADGKTRVLNAAGDPQITVESPNEDEAWKVGREETIEWTMQGVSGDIYIWLYRGDGELIRGIYKWRGSGPATWTVPPYIEPGSDYYIVIFSQENPDIRDRSDGTFTIEEGTGPYITALSPDEGDRWTIGETATIRWTSRHVQGDIEIRLYKGNTVVDRYITRETDNDGTYTWNVPTDVEPRGDYYISVGSIENGSVWDTSLRFAIGYPNVDPVGDFDVSVEARDVKVVGDYAYVADVGGLSVVDILDPEKPVRIGFAETPGDAVTVAVAGSTAYVADTDGGLRIIDVSNPEQPGEIGSFDPSEEVWGVAVAGSYAYLAAEEAGLYIVDVSSPEAPREAARFDTPGSAKNVQVVDGRAYVSDLDAGLRILDVSDPTAPDELGAFASSGRTWDVDIVGNYAYVAADDAGLRILDVSDPASPEEVGSFGTPDSAWDVAVWSNYAYVAADDAGLRTIDVTNPADPFEAGYFVTSDKAYGLAASGQYVYVAARESGLVVRNRLLRAGDNTPPAAPTGLMAEASDGRVTLSWNANTESDLAEYRLYRFGLPAQNAELVATIPSGTEEHTDTGLTSGTEYSYWLRAVDEAGNLSQLSDEVQVTPGGASGRLVINELLADPAGTVDANGDGALSSTDDEFVELFNGTGEAVDLSEYAITDDADNTYTFPDGTTLGPKAGAVVFGGGAPTGISGFTDTGLPELDDRGDTVTLTDADGEAVDDVSYEGGEASGVSLARNPDGTGGFQPQNTFGAETRHTAGRNNETGESLPGVSVEMSAEGAPQMARALDVTASLSSADFQPTTSALFYRQTGQRGPESYQSTSFEPQEGGVLVATIPAKTMTLRGVEYYARFTDGARTVTVPADDPASNPARVRVAVGEHTSPVTAAPRTYRMISVPLAPEDSAASALLEDDFGSQDPSRWRLLRWDPEAEQYRELSDLESGFAPGRAFWLVTRGGGGFDVEGGWSVDASAPLAITLQPGWNQIATPFAFPVAWEDVGRGEAVEDPVYFNGDIFEAQPVRVLEPWEGYFVYNNGTEPATISVPPVEASVSEASVSEASVSEASVSEASVSEATVSEATASAKASGAVASETSASEAIAPEVNYALRLHARHEHLRDARTVIGFAEAAARGRDRMDFAEPPGVGDYVRLSVMQDRERLDGSFKPSGEAGQWWDLEVHLQMGGQRPPAPRRVTVTLAVEQGQLPEGYERYVFDRDNGRVLPVEGQRLSVEVGGDRPVRRLRLVLGTPAFAETRSEGAPLEPVAFALEKNVPNPFAGKTRIRYRLAERCQVALDVYNVLGQRVATLIEEEQGAGSHEVQWMASGVAAGVYFYRIRAGSFTASQKMVLIR